MIDFDTHKVGGLRWARLGRLSLALCVSREFQPIGADGAERMARRARELRTLGARCATVFGCIVLAGLPLVVGGVL